MNTSLGMPESPALVHENKEINAGKIPLRHSDLNPQRACVLKILFLILTQPDTPAWKAVEAGIEKSIIDEAETELESLGASKKLSAAMQSKDPTALVQAILGMRSRLGCAIRFWVWGIYVVKSERKGLGFFLVLCH